MIEGPRCGSGLAFYCPARSVEIKSISGNFLTFKAIFPDSRILRGKTL